MEKTELILGLAQMLQNNGTNSFVSKLPKIDIKKLPPHKVVDQKVLLTFLNSRLELACVETNKAKGYLLIPFSRNQWKVFVFDNDYKPYAQLDDYNDIIMVTDINNTSKECKECLVVNR